MPHHREPDHDRLVRIEEVLSHLTEKLDEHIEELRAHIKDESEDFATVKQQLTLHLQESVAIREDVIKLKTDVGILKSERIRILGWIAGIIFTLGLAWSALTTWLDHSK